MALPQGPHSAIFHLAACLASTFQRGPQGGARPRRGALGSSHGACPTLETALILWPSYQPVGWLSFSLSLSCTCRKRQPRPLTHICIGALYIRCTSHARISNPLNKELCRPVVRVCYQLFLTRYMRPEGPWQRLAAALVASSRFPHVQ